MEPKFNFTQAKLAALKPTDKRSRYHDLKTPGLVLQVTPKGAKTFYFRKWVQWGVSTVFIGKFPQTSLAEARERCTLYLADTVRGGRPARAKGTQTLGELWDRYKRLWLARKRLRTRSTAESRYNACLKQWEGVLLAAITRDKVMDLHLKLSQSGKVQANRAVQLLRAMLNFGQVQNNPAKIPLFREESRTRRLTPEELPRFFKALAQEPQDWQDFFLLCLFTGARKSNVQRMRGEDLDLQAGVWTIPGEEFKTGRTKQIVLAERAVAILKRRPRQGWVFPCSGKLKGKAGHITEPKKVWARVCASAKIDGLRIHDLRRTLGSVQAGLGSSLLIVGASLGQDSPESTKIYTRLDLEPIRASVEAAVKAMTK